MNLAGELLVFLRMCQLSQNCNPQQKLRFSHVLSVAKHYTNPIGTYSALEDNFQLVVLFIVLTIGKSVQFHPSYAENQNPNTVHPKLVRLQNLQMLTG